MTEHADRLPSSARVYGLIDALQWPLLAAAAYYLAAESAFLVGTLSDRIFAPFWPPNVVLLCVFLNAPYARWPYFVATIFVAHVGAELRIGMGASQLMVAFLTNFLVAALSAVWLRSVVGGPPWLGDLRKAGCYILVTAGASPALVALAGALVPILGGSDPANYWIYWAHWYVANALACLTLGPICLAWFGSDGRLALDWPVRRSIEAAAVAALLLVVCLITFNWLHVAPSTFLPGMLYLPLPLALWMTFRFGAKGASAAILIVTVLLISNTLRGPSPFIGADIEVNVLALQLFLTGLSIPIIFLGAAIDQLRTTEATARKLAGSVLRAQDEERRRIARELHDSTGQNLVAAKLLLGKLQRGQPAAEGSISQVAELLQTSIADLRTMSYLLHPPLLDEAGLGLALRSYVEGFSARSGIDVDVEVPEGLERLPGDVELVLFRVAQEALTNVSRHSESKSAHIRLVREHSLDGANIVMTIENEQANAGRPSQVRSLLDGPLKPSRGVGLASMRERLSQIGGHLDVLSASGATLVRATIPVLAA